MPLVIPTARSTYGDSTTVPGSGHLSTYILAQLPDDANLSWVSEVRALCTVDELKWKVFQERRERLQAKNQIWNRILSSMRSATIVVIKPSDVEAAIREDWTTQGAEHGVDFNQRMLVDACATALIRDTPVAYLPNRLSEAMNLYPGSLFLEFDRFAPEQIKQRIGGKLRDAKVFAARAHATFDVVDPNTMTQISLRGIRKSCCPTSFQELLSTQRGFDEEHPPSVSVLNEAAEVMASALYEEERTVDAARMSALEGQLRRAKSRRERLYDDGVLSREEHKEKKQARVSEIREIEVTISSRESYFYVIPQIGAVIVEQCYCSSKETMLSTKS